jgi:hypothetical protein
MKQRIFNSIKKNGWLLTPIALAFVLLLLLGAPSGTAQSKKQKRVTSVRLGSANEGSRVTVVSDSALNDYEAYRRGDRFYVKIPAADFASGVPNLRGAGFEDVEVQKTADSSIISFRLQPGTVARVDQRSNRLDVIFSTRTRPENSAGTASSTGGAQNGGSDRTGTAGPASSTDNLRDGRNSSGSNPIRNDFPTSPSAPPPRQSTAAWRESLSGATPQGDSTPSSHGSTEIATGSISVATNTPQSLLAPVSSGEPLNSSEAMTQGATSSQRGPARGAFLRQWVTQHWLVVMIAALLGGLALVFVLHRRFESSRQPESMVRRGIKKRSIETGLRLQEEAFIGAPEELEHRRLETEGLGKKAEEEALKAAIERRARAQAEAPLRAEKARQGREETPDGQAQEETRVKAELEKRIRVDEEGRQRAGQNARFRSAEERRLRTEAEERRRVAEERLKVEQEVLMQLAVELTRRRAQVEERRKAE